VLVHTHSIFTPHTQIVFYQSRLLKQGIQVKVHFSFIINCLPVDAACNGNNLFKGKVIPVGTF